MQAALHRAKGDAERRGRLIAGELLEIPEHQHLSVRRREVAERPFERRPVLEALQQRIRRLFRAPPGIAPQVVERHEVGRFPDPATVLPVQRVPRNGEDPAAGGDAAAERSGGTPGGDEGVLKRVLGVRVGCRSRAEQAEDRGLVSFDELAERRPIPRRGLCQELRVAWTQRARLGRVLMPNSVYNGQVPTRPVRSGKSPRYPSGDLGPTNAKANRPRPRRMRATRSKACTLVGSSLPNMRGSLKEETKAAARQSRVAGKSQTPPERIHPGLSTGANPLPRTHHKRNSSLLGRAAPAPAAGQGRLNTAPWGMPLALPPWGHVLSSIRNPGSLAPASRKR